MPAPWVVFAGSYLFAGVAAVALAVAVGGFLAIPDLIRWQEEWVGDGAAEMPSVLGLAVFAMSAIVFAGVCLWLSVLDGRGVNRARILTWVVGGVAIWLDIGWLGFGGYSSVPWYGAATQTAAVVMLVLAAGAVTLLVLPTSSGYFRAMRSANPQRRSQALPQSPPAGPKLHGKPPAPTWQTPPARQATWQRPE